MGLLNRDKILGLSDREVVSFHVKEWEGDIRIKSLSVSDRLHIEAKYSDANGRIDFKKGDAPLEIIVLSVVDHKDRNMFSIEDLDSLRQKDSKAMFSILQKCLEVSWMGSSAIDEAKKN